MTDQSCLIFSSSQNLDIVVHRNPLPRQHGAMILHIRALGRGAWSIPESVSAQMEILHIPTHDVKC